MPPLQGPPKQGGAPNESSPAVSDPVRALLRKPDWPLHLHIPSPLSQTWEIDDALLNVLESSGINCPFCEEILFLDFFPPAHMECQYCNRPFDMAQRIEARVEQKVKALSWHVPTLLLAADAGLPSTTFFRGIFLAIRDAIWAIDTDRIEERLRESVARSSSTARSLRNSDGEPIEAIDDSFFVLAPLPLVSSGTTFAWSLSGKYFALRRITIDHMRHAGASLSMLSYVLASAGALRSLTLSNCDIWRTPVDENDLISFAVGIRRSNLRDLRLSGGHEFSHTEQDTALALRHVEVFLEALNSTTLETLVLTCSCDCADVTAPQRRRFELLIARFTRRSIHTDAYTHPARMHDPAQIGAPNLRRFCHSLGAYTDGHILATALLGAPLLDHLREEAEDADSHGKTIEATGPHFGSTSAPLAVGAVHEFDGSTLPRRSLPPNRTLIHTDGLLAYTPGFVVRPSTVLPIFLPLLDTDLSAASEEVLSEARAQAASFSAGVYRISLLDQAECVRIRIAQNELHEKELQRAASRVLCAARVLACRVLDQQDPTDGCRWLSLPPEIRRAILRGCDKHDLLSPSQFNAVLSFACDRRTIGYGRINELLLFRRRLDEEAERERERCSLVDRALARFKDQRPVLDLVHAQPWSFKEALSRALPADFETEALHSGRRYRGGAYEAFIAVTGCRTPILERDLGGVQL